MTAGELLDLYRDDSGDNVAPYLWSDDLILSHIDDAQTMFCRLTDGISDATTPAVTQLAVLPTVEWYSLHESILKVRSAARADTGRPVEVLNVEDMPTRQMYFDGIAGTVRALILGIEADQVRMWPVPSETVTVNLTVFREPLVRITDGDQSFEIPAKHHKHLLLWVHHLALMKHDSEVSDRKKSADMKAAFEAYCFAAKVEQGKARHKPRTVAYGGI